MVQPQPSTTYAPAPETPRGSRWEPYYTLPRNATQSEGQRQGVTQPSQFRQDLRVEIFFRGRAEAPPLAELEIDKRVAGSQWPVLFPQANKAA